jgi:hypothetical protein
MTRDERIAMRDRMRSEVHELFDEIGSLAEIAKGVLTSTDVEESEIPTLTKCIREKAQQADTLLEEYWNREDEVEREPDPPRKRQRPDVRELHPVEAVSGGNGDGPASLE